MRGPDEWRVLNRRTVAPHFPDPSLLPRRRDVADDDRERILDAVRLAIPRCRESEDPRLPGLLVHACAELGWQEEHPLSVWTVAIYANRFPLYRAHGGLTRDWPDRALRCAYEDCFWADHDLVRLARRRWALGWTRTAEPPPEALAAMRAEAVARRGGHP